jgi:hypothetical protein
VAAVPLCRCALCVNASSQGRHDGPRSRPRKAHTAPRPDMPGHFHLTTGPWLMGPSFCVWSADQGTLAQGALGKRKKNAHGGGWVLFLGISGPEKHLFVFRVSQDAPPQMTQRTSWLCLCVVEVVGQEIPEVPYPTDLSSGYKIGPECRKTASVRGIGSKWPNMGLQHAIRAWEVCCRAV